MGIERSGTSFYAGDREVAVNAVYRFLDSSDALIGYRDLSDSWFRAVPYETEWSVPPDLDKSSFAIESRVACNDDTNLGVHQCRFIALYDQYVADLSYRTRELNLDEFQALLLDMDRRFQECLPTDQ